MDSRPKRTWDRRYFSSTPYIVNGMEYHRICCVDCFMEQFGRLPKSPNTVNYDFAYMLDIPDDILKEDIRLSKSITLEKMIKKYGNIEGPKNFSVYCEKQAISNTYEYKKKKFGWDETKFKEYNDSRSVTIVNCIGRHGEEEGIRIFNDYCEKQAYAGSSKQYFIDMYGEEDGTLRWNVICKSKAITMDNFIRKYGEVEGPVRFLSSVQKGYSKSSQAFFWELYKLLPAEYQSYTSFAELNKEYVRYSEEDNCKYAYDFVIGKVRLCIEYNGEHVHPRKDVLTLNEWNSWRCTWSKRTADEKFDFDCKKSNFIKSVGYDLKVVWVKDITSGIVTVNDCYNWIKERIDQYESRR